MPKKLDYEKILHSGNGKQKGLIVANSYAKDAINNKPFLTREQIMTIVESIRTDRETYAYNMVVRIEYPLRFQTFNTIIIYENFLNDLNLLTYCSALKDNHKRTEQIVESLPPEHFLPEREKPHPTKLHLFKKLKKKNINIIPLDPFNYGRYLDNQLAQTFRRIEQHTINLKTMIQAIRDRMAETKVRIDIYTKKLKEIESSVKDIYPEVSILQELHKKEIQPLRMGTKLKISTPTSKQSPREYEALPIDEKLYKTARITLTGKDYGERQ